MKTKRTFIAVGILAGLFLLLQLFSHYYVSFLWFQNLGFANLFTKPIITKIILFLVSTLLYFIFIRFAILHALRVYDRARKDYIDIRNPMDMPFMQRAEQLENINLSALRKPLTIGAAVFSIFLGLNFAAEGWMRVLEFINAAPYGLTDPVFNMDVGFYFFQIPLIEFLLSKIGGIVFPVFILSTIFYFTTGLITFNQRTNPKFSMYVGIRKWLGLLLALSFLVLGANNLMNVFSALYSQRGYVFGGGFTDIHVAIPLALILGLVAILAAVSALIYRKKQNFKLLSYPLLAFAAVFLLGNVTATIVQYTVSNNEYAREKPYIEREMAFTQEAYGIGDISVRDYPGDDPLAYEDMVENAATIDNVRLNDPQPLKEVISQQQGLRYYYRFEDIDVDRYIIDGAMREVLLAPRELSQEALNEKAGTFINLTMRYTHGYGLVGSLANQMDTNGYADLVLSDIPPLTQMPALEISQPRIYYGELTNDQEYGYVIGNSKTEEFDYPKGDSNAGYFYDGSGGIAFKGFNKLALSFYFNTPRFFITTEIDEDARLLMVRNIEERVQKLAPFLSYDADPYMVIREDGSLQWIIDAYTTKDRFPYAKPYGNINYIRNSVKVTVDPYDGDVHFYVFDEDDPVVATYAKIFPEVFSSRDDMPEDLNKHVRYPEDYFAVQSEMLLDYHVQDSSVFYNKEDTWNIAKRATEGGMTAKIQPYYAVMTLPDNEDKDDTEFVLKMPFTPTTRGDQPRNNMVAWMVGRSDPGKYGELILYQLPKNREIQGPLMVDSLIDQSTEISSKLSLWDESGSNVIRGNLITLPMNGGFIYVEPIFLKAEREGSSIPQMQAIVFAVGKELIMVETNDLDVAINAFFKISELDGDHAVVENPDDLDDLLPSDDDEADQAGGESSDTDLVLSVDREELLSIIKSLKDQIGDLEILIETIEPVEEEVGPEAN